MSRESRDPWAFVTGSSRGIGRATAIELARRGWNVGVHYWKSEQGAAETQANIEALGRRSFLLKANLREPVSAGPLVAEAWMKANGLDAWVHIAGADVLTGEAAHLSYEQKLEETMRVDLVGTILACRSVGKRMAARGSGSIITIGWDQAATGMEGDTGEIFAAVKGGIASFTRSLAKSLAPNVRINCIAPGWIKTAWGEGASKVWHDRVQRETPLKRWGSPDDVARAVAFLVSDDSNFLTGQTLNVNGGVVTS